MCFTVFCIPLYCVSVLTIQKSYLISDNDGALKLLSRSFYLIYFLSKILVHYLLFTATVLKYKSC